MNDDVHHHAHDLLGAYALDAVDPDEGRQVEAHLNGCLTCQDDLHSYREAAVRLVPNAPAPDELWPSIVTALEEPPPPLDLAPVVPLLARRARTARVLAALTAVAAAATVTLGVRLANQEQQLHRLQAAMTADDMQRAALTALANPTATTIELRAPTGRAAARVALLPDGRGYLLADGLPTLTTTRTYQLWALIDGQRISAGTLGPQPNVAAFHVSGPVGGFAVTDEQAPGVTASKNPPLLIGWSRSA